ncbi:lissencephaly-1 homolog isoform X2 [Bacillus rossius redtenbacheri]|uniref:lissencephaly-1 homolog isoform X2 n=1 Tax=Bacillus rossius redtenbacheri TaxID=93214 RepID=UPI002FDD5217
MDSESTVSSGENFQKRVLHQLLHGAYDSYLIKHLIEWLSVVLTKDLIYSRSVYRSTRFSKEAVAIRNGAQDNDGAEKHISMFRELNQRRKSVAIFELLSYGDVSLVYETYWLCRAVALSETSGEPSETTVSLQRPSQELGDTGRHLVDQKKPKIILTEIDGRKESKERDRQDGRTTDVAQEMASHVPDEDEATEVAEGPAYDKENIGADLKRLRGLWNNKMKNIERQLKASGKGKKKKTTTKKKKESAKKPAKKAKEKTKEKTQKKKKKKRKAAVFGSMDWEKIAKSISVFDDEMPADDEAISEPLFLGVTVKETNQTKNRDIFSEKFIISSIIHEFQYSRVIAWAHKSNLMAVSTANNSVVFFSLLSGKMLKPLLSGHIGRITCMCFHPDTNHIVTGSSDTTARCWNIWACTEVKAYQGHEKRITCLSVNEDYVASGDEDHRIRVFQVWSGMCVSELQEEHPITALQLQQGPQLRLFSGCGSGEISLYDVMASALLARVRVHRRAVTSLSLQSPLLASGGLDGWVRLWDSRLSQPSCLGAMDHGSPVLTLHLTGPHVVSGCHRSQLKIWHIATRKLVKVILVDSRPLLQVYCAYNKDHVKIVVNTDLDVIIYIFGSTKMVTHHRKAEPSTLQPVFGTSSVVECLSDIMRIIR